jgi:hypothetical protein
LACPIPTIVTVLANTTLGRVPDRSAARISDLTGSMLMSSSPAGSASGTQIESDGCMITCTGHHIEPGPLVAQIGPDKLDV